MSAIKYFFKSNPAGGAASSAVAPSVYWVQAHGTPVVQSTAPAGGFFGRAPIFANSSSFEPTYAGP